MFSAASRPAAAAVIPAYNEAGRIGGLLAVLRQVEELAEIIVVDDGSEDGTFAEARQAEAADPRLRVLSHPANQGKGQALGSGWRAARAAYLLFLDADLTNLTPAHVRALLAPVLSGQADMAIGQFCGGKRHTDLAHRLTPWLSGQRCLKAGLLAGLSPAAAAGYGIETALTLAARKNGWRCQAVPLPGVSHPASDFQRGLRAGLQTRARMYADIWRAWWANADRPALKAQIPLRLRLLMLIMMLLLGSMLAYDRSRASSYLGLDDLPVITLEGARRLLVVAPHPDDETLGAAGLIQAALEGGLEVRVVVLTNGDGQPLAPLALNGQLRPSQADFLALGQRRQMETLAAMAHLGLTPDEIDFLGYPDGRLLAMWLGDWETACPLQASFTRATHNPYPVSYNPAAAYCGSDLLADLRGILNHFRPDIVAVPHPNDDHGDHRAGHNFARLALTLEGEADPEYRPAVWGYLTHYGHFPRPRGDYRRNALLPPIPLSGSHNQWMRLDLSNEQVANKFEATREHASQVRLLGRFLPSFVRGNEIFVELPLLDLSPIGFSAVPLSESGMQELPELREPASESTQRLLFGGADLVGWKIARLGNTLLLTAEARGPLVPGVHYRILVKTPGGQTRIFTSRSPEMALNYRSFTVQIDLEELGEPPVLAMAADAQQTVTLDRTGWYFLALRNWQLPAIGEQLPAIGEQLSSISEQLPAIGDPRPSLGEQLPALGEQLTAIGEQLPAISEPLATLGEQLTSLGEQLQENNDP